MKELIHDKPLAPVTISLFLGLCGFYALNIWAYFHGHTSLFQSFIINILIGYFIFTPLHEASHGNVAGSSKHKWLDQIVGEISGMVLFVPFMMFKILHLRHHSNTNHPQNDPDYWVAQPNFIRILLAAFTIMPHYYRNAIFNPTSRIKEELPATLLRKFLMIALIIFISIYFKTVAPLVLWPLSALFSLAILAIVFDWLPHQPYRSMERYYDTKIINYKVLTPLLMSQNYHLIHHLYPRIPWYRYDRCFELLEKELREKKVEIIG